MSRLHTVCVSTHSQSYYPVLQKSAERHGVDVTSLGFGQEWTGTAMKIDLLDEYLGQLDDDDLLLFIDAFDVVLFADEKQIRRSFEDYQQKHPNCKVLIGAHAAPNPLMRYLMERSFMSGPGCETLLCCGTFMGKVRDVKNLFEALKDKIEELQTYDDQIVFVSVYGQQRRRLGMCLDAHSEVFATLCPPKNFACMLAGSTSMDHLEVTKHLRVKNKNNGAFPVLVHAPGETCIDRLLRDLKYVVPPKSVTEHLKLVGKKVKFYAKFVDKPRQALVGIFTSLFLVIFIAAAAASPSIVVKSGCVTMMVATLTVLLII
mgnify:CR=1 FL=1